MTKNLTGLSKDEIRAQIDSLELPNAGTIVQMFGGIRPMAKKLGVPVTTVQGWKKRDLIPVGRVKGVLDRAAELGYDVGQIESMMVVASDNTIKTVIKNQDFSGICGQSLMLHALPGSIAERVLLVGLGERSAASREQWQEACAAAAKALCETPSVAAISDCLVTCTIDGMTCSEQASQLATELVKATYVFNLHEGTKQWQSPLSRHRQLLFNSWFGSCRTQNPVNQTSLYFNLSARTLRFRASDFIRKEPRAALLMVAVSPTLILHLPASSFWRHT